MSDPYAAQWNQSPAQRDRPQVLLLDQTTTCPAVHPDIQGSDEGAGLLEPGRSQEAGDSRGGARRSCWRLSSPGKSYRAQTGTTDLFGARSWSLPLIFRTSGVDVSR